MLFLTDATIDRLSIDQDGAALRLGDGDAPASAEQLLTALKLTLEYSTRTSHPLFFNQLYGGPEPVGIAGLF